MNKRLILSVASAFFIMATAFSAHAGIALPDGDGHTLSQDKYVQIADFGITAEAPQLVGASMAVVATAPLTFTHSEVAAAMPLQSGENYSAYLRIGWHSSHLYT